MGTRYELTDAVKSIVIKDKGNNIRKVPIPTLRTERASYRYKDLATNQSQEFTGKLTEIYGYENDPEIHVTLTNLMGQIKTLGKGRLFGTPDNLAIMLEDVESVE